MNETSPSAPNRAARVLGRSGGYRRSYAFAMTCLIYHATTTFCRRNYNYKNDALGKTVGQMVGAARSARQNIVEGSERGATSKEQELKQYDVAKGSLAELAGDYEAFITDANEIAWSEKSAEYAAVRVLRRRSRKLGLRSAMPSVASARTARRSFVRNAAHR